MLPSPRPRLPLPPTAGRQQCCRLQALQLVPLCSPHTGPAGVSGAPGLGLLGPLLVSLVGGVSASAVDLDSLPCGDSPAGSTLGRRSGRALHAAPQDPIYCATAQAREGRGWGRGLGQPLSRHLGQCWVLPGVRGPLPLSYGCSKPGPWPPGCIPDPPAAPGEARPPGKAARMERKPIWRQPLRQRLVFLSQGQGPPGAAPHCPHPTHVAGVARCRCPPLGWPLTAPPATGTPA